MWERMLFLDLSSGVLGVVGFVCCDAQEWNRSTVTNVQVFGSIGSFIVKNISGKPPELRGAHALSGKAGDSRADTRAAEREGQRGLEGGGASAGGAPHRPITSS